MAQSIICSFAMKLIWTSTQTTWKRIQEIKLLKYLNCKFTVKTKSVIDLHIVMEKKNFIFQFTQR